MKRFILFFLVFLFIPIVCLANDTEYNEYLNTFDLSFIDELSSEIKNYLSEMDIDKFDYNSISNISIESIVNIVNDMLQKRLKTPIKSCVLVISLVLLSAFFKNLNDASSTSLNEIYSTISSLAIGVLLLAKIGLTLELATASLSIASNFIFAFIPTFCAIVAVGGGIATSFSTNTMLLVLSQALSYISSNIFMPIINSFLALSVCSSLRSELNLGSFLSTVKRILTSSISFISAMFISILSIKTTVSVNADILGIRSIRFVINSVVPIIGGSISDGLMSIQSYSSLIKSTVGIVGIISVALVFLPSIIEIVIWRITLSFCSIVSDLFCDKSVSMLINSFKDTLLLINVVLILSLITTIISIGILIASRMV